MPICIPKEYQKRYEGEEKVVNYVAENSQDTITKTKEQTSIDKREEDNDNISLDHLYDSLFILFCHLDRRGLLLNSISHKHIK